MLSQQYSNVVGLCFYLMFLYDSSAVKGFTVHGVRIKRRRSLSRGMVLYGDDYDVLLFHIKKLLLYLMSGLFRL